MNDLAIRKAIDRLESVMSEMPQLPIETFHHFAPGLYARTIRVPAGAVITGKIHREGHLNIMAYGKIAVVTEDGENILEGCNIFTAPPGTKRVGYTIEDTVWITVHANPENRIDPGELERVLIAPSHEALEIDPKPSLESVEEDHF